MITIHQNILHTALKAVTRASLKGSLAALALVRLDASPRGILTLSCFNGETAARVRVNAQCGESLSAHVDAQILNAVVETLSGEIHLTVEQSTLVLQCDTNRTTLRLVEEPVPVIADEDHPGLVHLGGSVLLSLTRVLPFASTDCSRASLQVLYLSLDSETAIAQAADGYSAAQVQEHIQGPAEPLLLHLPLSVARLLANLTEEKDQVSISSLGENRYLFHIHNSDDAKDLTLATVAQAAAFPSEQIQNLIASAGRNALTQVALPQTSLMQSIRMIHAMGTQNTFIKVRNNLARIASAETDTGQARNLLEGQVSGQDVSLWLSAVYLKRSIEDCKGELVLRLADSKSPLLVEYGAFTSIIMPLLIEGSKDPFPEDEAIELTFPDLVPA
jgi:DNA polymerase III sliding clamp (beta) subunit (PCNA family)